MNNYRRPPQRLSELIDPSNQNNRKSRLDAPKRSFIPRPGSKGGGSMDRVSGVQPLDGFCFPNQQSSVKGYTSTSQSASRHRSAESGRATFSHQRPRAESVQRPSGQSRSRSTLARETPVQKTPLSRTTMMQTPMSCMSTQSGGHRTPSAERKRSRLILLEKAALAIPGKDRRVLANPEWQKRTCERVVSRLRSDPVASTLIGQGPAPLKPVTIRLFVELVNCLIGSPRCHVNIGNYVQKLPTISRRLLYPGAMTKSWLKSVNAMHTYSQMLAFLSYLVDFSDVKEYIANTMDLESIYGNTERGQLAMLRHEYYCKCWHVFQEYGNYEPFVDEYIADLKNIRGIPTDDEVMELQEEIECIKLEVHGPSVIEGRRREQELRNIPPILEEEVRGLRQRISDLRQDLKSGNAQFASQKDSFVLAKETTHASEEEVESLRSRLTSQGMSVKQREEIIAKTEQIMAAADSKKDLVDDLQKIGYKKDIEMAKVQKIALTASNTFNRSLVSVGLAAGENLTKYSLEERELLAGSTPKSIMEMKDILINMKSKAEERLLAARQNKDEGASQKQQIKLNIESEHDRLKTLQAENVQLEHKSEEMRRRLTADVNSKRALAQTSRQNGQLLREKALENLREKETELNYWKDQDSKWRQKLEQLINEEPLVHETCQKRAQSVISEYITRAKSVAEL